MGMGDIPDYLNARSWWVGLKANIINWLLVVLPIAVLLVLALGGAMSIFLDPMLGLWGLIALFPLALIVILTWGMIIVPFSVDTAREFDNLGNIGDYLNFESWWVGIKATVLGIIFVSLPSVVLGVIPMFGFILSWIWILTVGIMLVPWTVDVARGD